MPIYDDKTEGSKGFSKKLTNLTIEQFSDESKADSHHIKKPFFVTISCLRKADSARFVKNN